MRCLWRYSGKSSAGLKVRKTKLTWDLHSDIELAEIFYTVFSRKSKIPPLIIRSTNRCPPYVTTNATTLMIIFCSDNSLQIGLQSTEYFGFLPNWVFLCREKYGIIPLFKNVRRGHMGKSTLTDYINDSELLVWCDTLLKFRILSYTFRFACLKQEEYLHAKSFAQGFFLSSQCLWVLPDPRR